MFAAVGRMDEERARLMGPLQLAYLGDSVWDLLVRSRLVHRGLNVQHMHREAIARVNAGAQAEAFRRLREHLTEREASVAMRGRNAHPHHGVPKNQHPQDYADATALESLMGYLCLTGQEARIRELFAIAQEETSHAEG